ncbi:MAG: GNAT family N-acetyltransferase [Deinococcus sp.]
MDAPLPLVTLSAGRFTLRPFGPGDQGLIQEAGHDPLIPLITSVPSPCDAPGAQAFILRQHVRLTSGEGYSLAIAEGNGAEGEDSVAVGQIGLWLQSGGQGRASVGYWVVESARRRGAAGQALRAVSRWGLTLPGIERLELYVEPWNEGSWRTAEGVGYRREGLLRSWQRVGERRRDMYMYSLLASDLPKGRGKAEPT